MSAHRRNTVGSFRIITVLSALGATCWLGVLAADSPHPDSPRAEVRKLEQRAAELKALGQDDEAQKLMAEARELRTQGPANTGKQPRGGVRPGPGLGPDPKGPQPRLEHLRVAVEQLHAAGLHELAERVAQEGNRQRERIGREGPSGAAPEELRRLRDEVRELRELVQDLRRRMEERRRTRI